MPHKAMIFFLRFAFEQAAYHASAWQMIDWRTRRRTHTSVVSFSTIYVIVPVAWRACVPDSCVRMCVFVRASWKKHILKKFRTRACGQQKNIFEYMCTHPQATTHSQPAVKPDCTRHMACMAERGTLRRIWLLLTWISFKRTKRNRIGSEAHNNVSCVCVLLRSLSLSGHPGG